jgi:thioredoxin reductase (NADPH)
MKKPVILTVDDEPAVLAAVARDLRKEYGREYSVVRADSGLSALDALRELRREDVPVALFLVDQRMPGMTGVDLLKEAMLLYPDAHRVLLTAYADTDVAIRAINEIRLDHYLVKPWDPPEEHLYPVLTDLLDTWRARYQPPFEGVRIVGHQWSADSHRVKDFLARNLIPFQWLDVEDDAAAAELLATVGASDAVLPVVVFPDGGHAARPTNGELGARIGLQVHAEADAYDLVIVGAGPAGLAAGVYGASEGLRTVLLEREAPGGQAGMSSRIENYLGFPAGLSGGDLARRAVGQARRLGAEILTPAEARAVRLQEGYPIVDLADGSELRARAVIIATGVSYRLLDVPGADRLAGSGVYYGAAITEALGTAGQDVYVLGGGNSAGQAAMYLSRFARSVTILVRSPSVEQTMSRYLIDQIQGTPNITIRGRVQVTGVLGENRLEAVVVEEHGGGQEVLPAGALFIFIGAMPRTDWLGDVVARDGHGFVLTGADVIKGGSRPAGWSARRDPLWLETSVPGIFAAGDVRHRSVKRIASAVGEGAMAVQFVHTHLLAPMLAAPRPVTAAV